MFPPGTPYDKRTFSFLSPLPFESVSLPLTIIGDPTLVDCEEVEIEINVVLEVDGSSTSRPTLKLESFKM